MDSANERRKRVNTVYFSHASHQGAEPSEAAVGAPSLFQGEIALDVRPRGQTLRKYPTRIDGVLQALRQAEANRFERHGFLESKHMPTSQETQ